MTSTCQVRCAHMYNGVITAMEVANHFMIGFEACSTEGTYP